jgi:tripartite-type tricarboxylate transporter receptor subunit TctC
MRRLIIRLAGALVGIVAAVSTAAAEYPDRPIQMIVPFEPGAGADILARTIGAKLQTVLGQPVVVMNRSGAGGNIGTEVAAHSAPDGYTLLLFNNSQTLNASLNAKLPFDVEKDFVAVSMLATSPILLCASEKFPPKTIQEVVALAKASPGKYNYGSAGYGTPLHFAGEMLNMLADIKLVHVPYKGQGGSSKALVGGDIDLAFGTVAGFAPLVQGGLVKPIAAAGAKRMKEMPDLPTIAESGYPDFDVHIWYGLVAPAGTPPDVVKKLNGAIGSILANPAERADIEKKGYGVTPSTSAEMMAFIKTDLARWKGLVQKADISAPK